MKSTKKQSYDTSLVCIEKLSRCSIKRKGFTAHQYSWCAIRTLDWADSRSKLARALLW